MSEVNISLYELLNLSIGTPQNGTVNFGALHALLHAILGQLDIRETKTGWRDTPPGDGHPHAPVGVTVSKQDQQDGAAIQRVEDELRTGPEQQERIASSPSPTPSSSSPADRQRRLRSRIQTCEDDLTKAMTLIQQLHDQNHSLREEIKELRLQQKMVDAEAETVSALEKCCHRVDVLQETVRSLRETVQKYPEELSQCVTWDVLQSAVLGGTGRLQKELESSGVVDATNTSFNSNFTSHTSTPSSPHPAEDTGRPGAPGSPSTATLPVQSETPQEAHPTADRTAAGTPPSRKGSERYPETVEALRSIGKLKEKFHKMEARVVVLEEVEQSQLTGLREIITKKGSQDASNNLLDRLNQQTAVIDGLMCEQEKKVELLNDVQKTMLQLQAECEKLQQDSRHTRSLVQKLYKTTEELENKKADKQMVESEMKADKSALDGKVSRLQFDSVTEQLNAMFHELLNKVTGQEQDWHKVVDRLSTEMECKLNRMELDSVKKQLEGRWRNIQEKLQAQGAPEHEDAAALRKQLVDRFHCLSCDRPVVKYSPGPHLVTLPSTPGFPAHNRPIRPFTVYALEQFRQHYRSEHLSEPTDYSHMIVTRSCGGSHTVTPAGQRRSGLQAVKTEADGVTQSEEIDIIGLDGHIYKGRLNAPVLRNTETKLPTISTKDGSSKTKDKNKPHKPAASPEAGLSAHHHNSAKSVQCSRSASSSSGRDWPVSALGCTSQSSFTQASAAAESNADETVDQ